MRNWIRHVDERIGNLIIFNWKHGLAKTASQWSDEELAERLKKVPSKERQEAWLRAARRPYTAEEEGEARRKLVLLLDRMEESLGRHAWLVGERYSLADIAVVPFVKRIDEEIAPDEVSRGEAPARAGLVAGDPGAAGLRRGEDRAVRLTSSAAPRQARRERCRRPNSRAAQPRGRRRRRDPVWSRSQSRTSMAITPARLTAVFN